MPPSTTRTLAALLLALLALDIPVSALNIPFFPPRPFPPSQRPSASSSQPFELRHALHIGGHRHPHLFRRKDFTSLDRRIIDFRASALSLPVMMDDGIAGVEELEAYESTHMLRMETERMWRPKGGMREWERSRRRAFLEDREKRGSKKAAVELAEMEEELRRAKTLGGVEVGGLKELEWAEEDMETPDVRDLATLRSLAMMTSNAYALPGEGGWYDPVGGDYNVSDSFGWERDGVRGHVFTTPDNSTVVVSIKGTSAGFLWSGGNTAINDKLNDNLLFSCCCARVDWTWSPVCDCYRGSYQCALPCLEDSLMEKSVYFPIATSLYNNVSLLYPDSTIWLTGHSLGGSLAALLGHTFGAPAVTFEAPADLLPARRLHLPLPPGAEWGKGREGNGVTHVYHTADPIPMGVCTGLLSACATAGFALESRCHSGRTILFDTVAKNKWSVDIRTHSIKNVINHVLVDDWDKSAPPPDPDDPSCKPSSVSSSSSSLWRLRWPWSGRKGHGTSPGDGNDDCDPDDGGQDGEGGDGKGKKGTPVPEATPEECEGGDCFRWEFVDDFDKVQEKRCAAMKV